MDSLAEHVEDLIRAVADREIMSRFKVLNPGDVRHKAHQGDLVTTADLESEKRLREGLMTLMPDSEFVGEEGVYKTPALLDQLKGAKPVWVIDPLDGTRNFAHGKPCFAVICALVEGGRTKMGWIFDPISGTCAVAQAGQGTYLDGRKLHTKSPDGPQNWIGSVGERIQSRLEKRRADGDAAIPGRFVRYHCAGREYMDLAMGKLQFALYGGRLMPWDHAAGALMIEEAGGIAASVEAAKPYDPLDHGHGERLLIAPDRTTFDALCPLFEHG